MKSQNSFLLLGIVLFYLNYATATSLTVCPDEKEAKELVGSEFVLVQPKSSTGLIRRIRLPQVGLYEHPLVCILIIDASFGSGGDTQVDITEGGLNHRYLEVRLTSEIGKGLDYMVMAYTAGISSMNNTILPIMGNKETVFD